MVHSSFWRRMNLKVRICHLRCPSFHCSEFLYQYHPCTYEPILRLNAVILTTDIVHAPLIITITLIAASLTALVTSLILPAVQLNLKLIQTIVDAPLNHLAFNIARGTALGCDLGIVAALCWLLGLRRTNIRRADNMINVLIVFTVQRGILQAVVQAGEVISVCLSRLGIQLQLIYVI